MERKPICIGEDGELKPTFVRNLFKFIDRNGLSVQLYDGCSEAGYDDKPMILADWNPPKMEKISNMIERLEEHGANITLEWDDEWTQCSHCYKGVRVSPDSYSWEPSYVWASDHEILCRDECWFESDWLDEVLEHNEIQPMMVENDRIGYRLLPSDFKAKLQELGFMCLGDEDQDGENCFRFESGFHPHQTDHPTPVLKELAEKLGFSVRRMLEDEFQMVIVRDYEEQFCTMWSIMYRPRVYD